MGPFWWCRPWRWGAVRAAVFAFCILGAAAAQAKGRIWSYTMQGTAYDARTHGPLANTALVIGTDTVMTDPQGRYVARIGGVTCDKGSSWAVARCDRRAYGHLLVCRVGGSAPVRIKSHWKKYAFSNKERDDRPTFHLDLHVP